MEARIKLYLTLAALDENGKIIYQQETELPSNNWIPRPDHRIAGVSEQIIPISIPANIGPEVSHFYCKITRVGVAVELSEAQRVSIIRIIEWMEGTLQSYSLLYDQVGLQTIPSVIREWEKIIDDLRTLLTD